MNKLILIHGEKRSGKGHLASKLSEKLSEMNKTSKIISFADPIKEIIAKTFGITLDELDALKNNEDITLNFSTTNGVDYAMSFRTIIQQFGTEAMHSAFGKDVWVNKMREEIAKSKDDVIIIPDFRFFHENIGGIKIKIFRNELESKDNHASESGLDNVKFDYVVDNSNFSNLTDDIDEILDIILK